MRAALKACERVQKAGSATLEQTPSPFNAYLRHIRSPSNEVQTSISSINWSDWRTPISLLELRAARIVEDRLEAHKQGEVDASADQRVSRAVTEAYVAAQIGEMIETVPLKEPSAGIVRSLLRLVSYIISCNMW